MNNKTIGAASLGGVRVILDCRAECGLCACMKPGAFGVLADKEIRGQTSHFTFKHGSTVKP